MPFGILHLGRGSWLSVYLFRHISFYVRIGRGGGGILGWWTPAAW